MSLVAVVIPVYKSILTENELISLRQCCSILKNYPIVLVVPENFNTQNYDIEFDRLSINCIKERFANIYFEDIAGYNSLMLSKSFYERFRSYSYILIHQLDAYVFRDELTEWCNKGYDYIGAPLIGNFTDTFFSEYMRVGNGGLSLRKIPTFINAFAFSKNLLTVKEIVKRIAVFRKPWTRIPLLILMKFGFKNKFIYFAKTWKHNEDDFWSGFLDNTHYSLTKPESLKALEFAFERFPLDCFEITKKLPFGCHAWEKYEYDGFWKNHIQV